MLWNVSAKRMHLPKQTVKSYATDPPAAMMIPRSSPHQQPSKPACVKENKSAHGNADSAENDTNTANGEETNETNNIAEAVQYKHSAGRDSQVQQHIQIRQCEAPAPEAACQKKSPYLRNTRPTRNRSPARSQNSSPGGTAT